MEIQTDRIILNSSWMTTKECKALYDFIHKYLVRTKHLWKDADYSIKIELIRNKRLPEPQANGERK